MEVKKYLRNKFFLFSVITVDVCFFWGYFLLASLDKIVYPSIAELYNSIFTVYTEFGMLIFPVLILYTFSNDYKNKNILFYKLMGYDFMKYFLEKLIINICSISIPTIFGLLIVGIIYDDFSYLSIMILYFESVICFQILLECLWGFLFKSMMVGYMVNFVYWLFSIIFATATEKLSFFARYDAANNVYLNLGEYFNTHNTNILDIQGNVMFTIFEFVIILSFIWFLEGDGKKMEYDSCGILLTENCNAKCKMCCDSRGRVVGKTLSKKELDVILSNIKECKTINVVGVTGGEPMLYPDLIDFIPVVKSDGYYACITFLNRINKKLDEKMEKLDDMVRGLVMFVMLSILSAF